MIHYIIEKNDKLDFQNPLDVENPFSFKLQLITTSSKICLADYVKTSFQKHPLIVVKSICNLYPNMIFSLNEEF